MDHYTVVEKLSDGFPVAYSLAKNGVPYGQTLSHTQDNFNHFRRQADSLNRPAKVETWRIVY